MVVVNAKVPARTVEEFIALAKQKPGSLNYGTAGAGTAHHLIGEMFKLKTGTDIVHIPYRGSAPALTDLIGGQVQVMFDTVTSGLPQVKDGMTRALAVTTARRSTVLPDVPTLAEGAIPGFDVGTWFGLLAPANTAPLHRGETESSGGRDRQLAGGQSTHVGPRGRTGRKFLGRNGRSDQERA